MFLIPALLTVFLLGSFALALRVAKFMGECNYPTPPVKETLK